MQHWHKRPNSNQTLCLSISRNRTHIIHRSGSVERMNFRRNSLNFPFPAQTPLQVVESQHCRWMKRLTSDTQSLLPNWRYPRALKLWWIWHLFPHTACSINPLLSCVAHFHDCHSSREIYSYFDVLTPIFLRLRWWQLASGCKDYVYIYVMVHALYVSSCACLFLVKWWLIQWQRPLSMCS